MVAGCGRRLGKLPFDRVARCSWRMSEDFSAGPKPSGKRCAGQEARDFGLGAAAICGEHEETGTASRVLM